MNKLKKIMDKTFWLYVFLGILNYGVCNLIMLVLHHEAGIDKDGSLHIEFALQTTVSFILNRWVTFRERKISCLWPILFFLSVGVSYLIAKILLLRAFEFLITLPFFYEIADWIHKFVAKALSPEDFRRDLVMLGCTFVYCVINYIGQRYFVFRPQKEQ